MMAGTILTKQELYRLLALMYVAEYVREIPTNTQMFQILDIGLL
jgi:hypothetical protein